MAMRMINLAGDGNGYVGNLALERRLGRGNTGTLGVVTDINGVQVSSNVKIARGLSMGGVRIGLWFTSRKARLVSAW